MELFVEVSVNAHCAHPLDVARARAKCDAVEDMADGLVVVRNPGGCRRAGQD
jgi:hypothetical protein